MRRNLDEGWADDGVYRKSLEDGPMREALEKRLEEIWAPGGACRRMVEDCVEINQ